MLATACKRSMASSSILRGYCSKLLQVVVEMILIKIGLVSGWTKIFVHNAVFIGRLIVEMISPHIDD
jgi:hypothetical protein